MLNFPKKAPYPPWPASPPSLPWVPQSQSWAGETPRATETRSSATSCGKSLYPLKNANIICPFCSEASALPTMSDDDCLSYYSDLEPTVLCVSTDGGQGVCDVRRLPSFSHINAIFKVIFFFPRVTLAGPSLTTQQVLFQRHFRNGFLSETCFAPLSRSPPGRELLQLLRRLHCGPGRLHQRPRIQRLD